MIAKTEKAGLEQINPLRVNGGRRNDMSICCMDIPPMGMNEQDYKHILI
ncbi:hypothetical protein LJC00_00340 [Dysgonomonas sp. OttesenSCG-928-M03]|nr:hypothetical protein [Dysgonomonas sp. OttesenSCG-928-M03]